MDESHPSHPAEGTNLTDQTETLRGSRNVFRDLNQPNPDLEQLRSILAANIIRSLDDQKLTVRAAQEMTGFAAADFSRIRRANIGRFTVDRLMDMLSKLGLEVAVEVSFKQRPAANRHPAPVAP